MNRITLKIKGTLLDSSKAKTNCRECQTPCKSACKTSCTIGNQTCEKRKKTNYKWIWKTR
jgi:predicted ribosomally synthesized six-cysteine peptide SCIFF